MPSSIELRSTAVSSPLTILIELIPDSTEIFSNYTVHSETYYVGGPHFIKVISDPF